MTLQEAISARHSVRQYLAKAVEAETAAKIQAAIDSANREGGVHIQMILNEPTAFASGLAKYGKFQNVNNYLAVVAPKGKDGDVKAGYYGELIVLTMQALGLNSCWVGLTFKKNKSAYAIGPDEELKCVISFGYGVDGGKQHPQKKTLKDVVVNQSGSDVLPDWFVKGIEAALLAPTAVNQQKFEFTLNADGTAEVKTKFSIVGYTHIDLGIVKCHFEIASGKKI